MPGTRAPRELRCAVAQKPSGITPCSIPTDSCLDSAPDLQLPELDRQRIHLGVDWGYPELSRISQRSALSPVGVSLRRESTYVGFHDHLPGQQARFNGTQGCRGIR